MIKCAKHFEKTPYSLAKGKGVSGVNGYLVEQIFTPETPFSLTTAEYLTWRIDTGD